MANFCKNNLIDAETVGLVINLLAKSKRIMPKIEFQDKWPNIDGYLYFLETPIDAHNDYAETLGTFEVQIKKLPKDHNLKFSVETDFLKYCKTSFNPVIFLGVDLETGTLYWLHISNGFINPYDAKLSQTTVTINLEESKKISAADIEYVSLWEKIIVDHRNKIVGYDQIKENLDSYILISQNSKLVPAKISKDYVNIHKFLDKLNGYLDNEFNIIKKIYLPSTWKLGFAFLNYEPANLSYSLFDIPYNMNDVQIKQIVLRGNIRDLMKKQKIDWFTSSARNKIEEDPKNVAFEWIETKLKKIIENKFLQISSIELLNEYLYEFTSHYHKELGLKLKDEYTIDEINNSLNQHLLLWVEELYRFKNIPLKHIMPVDLDSLFIFATDDEAMIIEENIQARIREGKFSLNRFIFTNKRYDFSKFIRFLESAKNREITIVKKVFRYGCKDMSGRRYTWEKWSKEELVYNTKILYSIMPKVYDEIIKENFGQIFEDLKFFKGFNKYIVVLTGAKDNYPPEFTSGPSLSIYRAIDPDSTENTVEVYDESESSYEENLQDKKFEVKTAHYDIFDEFPLLTCTYEYIRERLNNHIKELKNHR